MNGVPTRCDGGICYGKDGTDLCQMFNYPCGRAQPTTPPTTPAPALSCAKPCNLQFALDGIRSSSTSNIVNVNGNYYVTFIHPLITFIQLDSSLKSPPSATFPPTSAVLRTLQTQTCARGWGSLHSLENRTLHNLDLQKILKFQN